MWNPEPRSSILCPNGPFFINFSVWCLGQLSKNMMLSNKPVSLDRNSVERRNIGGDMLCATALSTGHTVIVNSKYWYRIRYVCISSCIKISRKTLIVIWYTLFTRFSRKVLLDFLSRWFLFLSYITSMYNLSCLLGERNEYQFELLLPPTPTPRENGNELFLVFCRIIFDAFDGYQNRIGEGGLFYAGIVFFSCQ